MNLKNSLFRKIKNFIYSSKLADINVYSKAYLNSVIKPYFSSGKSNYGSICIDFNKLNDINTRYGFETGDKVIYYTLYLIKSVLPSNASCSRIGGDEFVFIIENCTPNDVQTYVEKIYDVIKKHEKSILFSGVTAYGVHSSKINNLSEMINYSDIKITEIKNNCQDSSCSNWTILEQKLNKNLDSFFRNLRLYKEPINIDFLRKLYLHSISSCKNLLETDFSKSILLNNINSNTKNKLKYKNNITTSNTITNLNEIDDSCDSKNNLDALNSSNVQNCFNEIELEELYNLFESDENSKDEIDKIETSSYIDLLENLIRDPITGNFTNEYFSKYVIPNNKFKIKYFSMPFVKLYNTIFSHENTDMRFKDISEKLISYLENEQHINFEKNCFLGTPGNYFISLGGGNYVLALTEDTTVDNLAINNYVESISSNGQHLEDILTLVCSNDFHSVCSDNYDSVLESLSCECKELKDEYKLSILENSCIEDALSNIIYDSVKYYKDNIPNSEDIKQKTKFLNLLSQIMLNISDRLNKENYRSFER